MKKRYGIMVCVFVVVLITANVLMADSGNTANDSFTAAKKMLEKEVYYDHRITVYCGAEFSVQKRIKMPVGFQTDKYRSRANRVEWEHIVPAENFGRTFTEWREGHPDCHELNGQAFKGRKCADAVNREYRYMQADMYNLYPAIGAVNALRSNYNFTQFQEDTPSSFGSCPMKIQDRKAEPPPAVRGVIARTYLYFEQAYHRFRMSDANRKLMQVWDKQYPVDTWECVRACRIEKLQKNKNNIVRDACHRAHLWPQGEAC